MTLTESLLYCSGFDISTISSCEGLGLCCDVHNSSKRAISQYLSLHKELCEGVSKTKQQVCGLLFANYSTLLVNVELEFVQFLSFVDASLHTVLLRIGL